MQVINTTDLSADASLLIRVVLRGESRQGSYYVFNEHNLWDEKQNFINKTGKIILENNMPFYGLQNPRTLCN
jgi:hypothetical protein